MGSGWLSYHRVCSYEVDYDVDVAARCFGIRAGLMRGIHDGLGQVARDAWNTHVKARPQEKSALSQTQVYLGIDGRVGRESDLHSAGRQPHGALEAGRPTRGEQLFGIGAAGCAAGRGKLDIQTAVGAAGCTLSATRGVNFGGK